MLISKIEKRKCLTELVINPEAPSPINQNVKIKPLKAK